MRELTFLAIGLGLGYYIKSLRDQAKALDRREALKRAAATA